MEIQLLSKHGRKATVLVKDINFALANTLRRIMTAEVPTLAIDEVNFLKNDSALYDEIVAHRLGLIPLKTNLKTYQLKENPEDAGPTVEVMASLKVQGPCIVYAKDLKFQDPDVVPVYGEIPITELLEGQELEIEAKVIMGQGKDHMKFAPGFIHYQNYPEVIIKNKSSKAANDKIMASCPKDVFAVESGNLEVKNILNCDLCNACKDIAPDAVDIKYSDKDFIFYIESFGQLVTRRILMHSLKMLQEKLEDFEKNLKTAKKEDDSTLAALKNKITGKK